MSKALIPRCVVLLVAVGLLPSDLRAFPINRALAEAAFSDTLRIDGATGAGFVVYTYTLTGWAEGEPDAHLARARAGP